MSSCGNFISSHLSEQSHALEEKNIQDISAALIQLKIDKEIELVKMLEISLKEWTKTCAEFEGQQQEIDLEDQECDWKIKTLLLKETNEHLTKQIDKLTKRVREQKQKLKNPETPILSDETDWTKVIINLNRQVTHLKSELRNLQFRLDQESEAYYRVDEKRTALLNTAERGNRFKTVIDNLEVQYKENDEKIRRGIEKIYRAKRNRLIRELTCPIRRNTVSSVKTDETAGPQTVAVKPFPVQNASVHSNSMWRFTRQRNPSPSKIPLPANPAGQKIDLRRLAIIANATRYPTEEEGDA